MIRQEAVARNYAEALFELSQRHEGPEVFGEALHEVATLVEDVPAFRRFLVTPRLPVEEKRKVLRETFGERVPRPFLNFVLLTVDRGRQLHLPAIARAYDELLDEHLGRVRVDVTLARSPDEEEERELAERLSRVLGRKAVTRVRVDPKIVGGVIFRVGDRVYDGSLRRRLRSMRHQLLTADGR